MSNGRVWCQSELDQVKRLLAEEGELLVLAATIDRTPEAILVRAHKMLKEASQLGSP